MAEEHVNSPMEEGPTVETVSFKGQKERFDKLQSDIFDSLKTKAETFGKAVEEYVPTLLRNKLPEESAHLIIGTTLGLTAIVGGALMVDKIGRSQHSGRSKRGMWHGTDTGAFLAAGLGALSIAKGNTVGKTANIIGLSIMAGNAMYDYKFRHGDTQTNLLTNSIAGAVGAATYITTGRQLQSKAVQSYTEMLARKVPQGVRELETQINKLPGVQALMSIESIPLLAAVASVPISHSIITRVLARNHRRMKFADSIAPSMALDQSGGREGRTYAGTISSMQLPVVDFRSSGGTRETVNVQKVKREIG